MNFLELEPTSLKHLIVVAIKDQVASDLGGETVILNLRTGIYHGLDAIGTEIWNLLQNSTTVDNILNTLLQEYDVEPERCERELLALLQKLVDAELIEVVYEKTA